MTRLIAAAVCVLVLGGCPDEGDGGAGDGASEPDAGAPVFTDPIDAATGGDWPLGEVCTAMVDCRDLPRTSPLFVFTSVSTCVQTLGPTWDQAAADQCYADALGLCDGAECVLTGQ
jgi:hypothetical protein